MSFRTRLMAVLSMTGLVLAGIFACAPPLSDVVLPGQNPGVDPTPARAFTSFLSTERARVIRDDVNEGGAMLTVVSSADALFSWSNDAPPGLLQIEVPEDDAPAMESTLRIVRVASDPGVDGTPVEFTVVATEADADGEPRSVTARVTILIVRPRGPLTVSAASLSGNAVTPGSLVRMSARINGGRQFRIPNDTPTCSGTGALAPPDEDPPYDIVWNVTGIDGGRLSVACLRNDDGDTISEASFQTPVDTGNVIFTVEVTDASGNRFSDSVPIVISSSEALAFLQASAASATVVPGGTVALTAKGQGGTTPYSITFSINKSLLGGSLSGAGLTTAFDPSTQVESVTCDSRDFLEDCDASYRASGTRSGSDLVTVILTDAVGATASATVPLIVESSSTLRLTARSGNATVSPTSPGNVTTIDASINGGSGPYRVCFEATGPIKGTLSPGTSNCSATENCSCNVALAANGTAAVSRTYTATVGEGSDIINVRVIDAVGAEASAIVPLVIRPTEVLSLTAFAADTTLDPGGITEITASATGGVPPYQYEITKQDSLGTPANDPNLSQFNGPSMGTVNGPFMVDYQGHNATFFTNLVTPEPNVTDVVFVKVTDAVMQSRTASFTIFVGTSLSLFDALLATAPSQVAPGQPATIIVDFIGGTPPYEVVDISLFNTILGGAVDITCPVACSGFAFPCSGIPADMCGGGVTLADFSGTYTPPANMIGDQQLIATFRDAAGRQAIKVTNVSVLSSPLRVSASVTPSSIAPQAMATVLAAASGGTGVSQVTVEALGITAGTFDHDDCDVSLVCDNAPPFSWVYTAPLQEGTVLFRLTATGLAGEQATDFASLNVTSTNQLSVALTADSNVLNAGGMAELTATASGGTGPYDYVFSVDPSTLVRGCLDEPFALNCTRTISNMNVAGASMVDYFAPNTSTSNVVRVTVTDAVNATVTETLAISVDPPPLIVTGITRTPGNTVGQGFIVEGDDATLEVREAGPMPQVSGGVPPYTYMWSVSPTAGMFNSTTANPTTWTAPAFANNGSNQYTFTVIVRDSNTPTAAVGQTTTTVNVLEALAIDDTPTPAIGFSGTNPPGLNAGETINITMNVNRISGGQQPYLLDWVITGPGGVNINPAADNCNPVTGTCEATSFVSLAPSGGAPHVDDYMVSLTVTDSLGNTATTGPVTINVDDP